MSAEDNHFFGALTLFFGPLFIAGGWLAAFTDVGLGFILAGTAMLAATPLLWRSWRAALLAAALVTTGWTWPLLLSLA